MDPIVVEARLTEPLVTYGDGIHLDGPLAYAAFMDLSREARAAIPPLEEDWAVDFDLPLARWTSPCDLPSTADPRLTSDGILTTTTGGFVGVAWGWTCSAAVPIGRAVEATHNLRQRPPFDEYLRFSDARRAEVAMGPNKARDLVYPTALVSGLRWYAEGDADRVLTLLRRHVPAIGKLARHGPGRVAAWSVRSAGPDERWAIRGPAGQPMRRMPARAFPALPICLGTIRAPYHHRSRWAVTVAPEAWGGIHG